MATEVPADPLGDEWKVRWLTAVTPRNSVAGCFVNSCTVILFDSLPCTNGFSMWLKIQMGGNFAFKVAKQKEWNWRLMIYGSVGIYPCLTSCLSCFLWMFILLFLCKAHWIASVYELCCIGKLAVYQNCSFSTISKHLGLSGPHPNIIIF